MKIVVFGASRGAGFEVVKQALEAGHHVTAFVRTPEKFTLKHANLTVFQGDALDAVAVEKAISGQEAVVSALGPTRPPVPHMMETSREEHRGGDEKTRRAAHRLDDGRGRASA